MTHALETSRGFSVSVGRARNIGFVRRGAEGGHRLNDMLRYRGTPFNIPFKGEPGSVHANGVDQTGNVYGTTTCFPLPTVERDGNPNVP